MESCNIMICFISCWRKKIKVDYTSHIDKESIFELKNIELHLAKIPEDYISYSYRYKAPPFLKNNAGTLAQLRPT